MQPWLSVVIVNWNARERLRACLDALRRQTAQDFELVVVDNASTDGSQQVLREACPSAVLVQVRRNLGFAQACNLGIARARGAWILTLNNDTEAAPDFVERLRAAAATAADDVGMLQPCVLLGEGRERLNSTGVVVHRDGSANDRDFGRPLAAGAPPGDVLCVTAGAGLYRRAMLEATRLPTGYFDPAFFMYFEDVDLGWRARLAGWRAQYVPGAVVSHAFQASSRLHGPHFVTIQCMRNRVRTLLKNGSLRLLLRSLPRTASDLLWLLQHAGGRALAAWLLAVRDAVRQRGAVSRLRCCGRRDVERRWLVTKPG